LAILAALLYPVRYLCCVVNAPLKLSVKYTGAIGVVVIDRDIGPAFVSDLFQIDQQPGCIDTLYHA